MLHWVEIAFGPRCSAPRIVAFRVASLLLAVVSAAAVAKVKSCNDSVCWSEAPVRPSQTSLFSALHTEDGGNILGLPQLRFELESMDFGAIETGSSTLTQGVVLFNDSPSAPATDLRLELDAPFSVFPYMYQGTCEELDVLPPMSQCEVILKFAPMAPGTVAGLLIANSAEDAEAVLPLSGIGEDHYVLYAQHRNWEAQHNAFWFKSANTLPEPDHPSTAEAADDFVIEDPAGWTITKVGIEHWDMWWPFSDPPPMDVRFLPDAGGVPGSEDLCPESTFTPTMWDTLEKRAQIALSPACTLPPGHYWMQFRFRPESDLNMLYWGLQFVHSSQEPPAVQWHPPVWRNPGDGFFTGCVEWTALVPATCGLEDFPDMIPYGLVFMLAGQVGNDTIFATGFEID